MKTDGGVPLAAENKMEFGAKKIGLVVLIPPKDRFGVGGWEKVPQKDWVQSPEFRKGVKTAAHPYHPTKREYPPRAVDIGAFVREAETCTAQMAYCHLALTWWWSRPFYLVRPSPPYLYHYGDVIMGAMAS